MIHSSMRYCLLFLSGLLLASLSSWSFAQNHPSIIRYDTLFHPIIGRHGMVVSQRQIASAVGAEILAKGGNAVDAAVATGFALAVTLPRAGNIGGGGFMLVYLQDKNKTIALDYREMAPSGASRNMFLDSEGNVDKDLARRSSLSSGVPGTVAGLLYALDHYGSMSLAEVITPAITLADKGFIVPWDLSEILKARQAALTKNPATAKALYKKDNQPYEAGERLVQKDLAGTLKEIRKHGADAFYRGKIAKQIIAEIQSRNGVMSLNDLNNYKVAVREPVRGSYRGYEVVSMPPSSSGGIHIIQMLNILSRYPMHAYGHNSAKEIHVTTEAMKRAYADRAQHLGDMDYYDVPIKGLTSQAYADELAKGINLDKATPSKEIKAGNPLPYESDQTTHFSVADKYGNVVSNTYTLNFSFGSGIMVPGAGFLLNNEMDDFSAKPGVANAFGLLGNEANSISPGKRPLSSMTPTIVFKAGKPYIVTGSPGGSRIITTVLQLLINTLDYKMNIAEATAQPRFHHQWLPDRLQMEPGFSPDTIAILKSMGHNVVSSSSQGSLQSIMIDDGVFYGASDLRRPGAGAVGVN